MLLLVACGGGSQIADTRTPGTKVVANVEVEPLPTKQSVKPEPTNSLTPNPSHTKPPPRTTLTAKAKGVAPSLPTPTNNPTATYTSTVLSTLAPVSTQTGALVSGSATPSPTLTAPSTKPSISCKLDQEQPKVSCHATGYREGAQLNWSESASSKTWGGEAFEFDLHLAHYSR